MYRGIKQEQNLSRVMDLIKCGVLFVSWPDTACCKSWTNWVGSQVQLFLHWKPQAPCWHVIILLVPQVKTSCRNNIARCCCETSTWVPALQIKWGIGFQGRYFFVMTRRAFFLKGMDTPMSMHMLWISWVKYIQYTHVYLFIYIYICIYIYVLYVFVYR